MVPPVPITVILGRRAVCAAMADGSSRATRRAGSNAGGKRVTFMNSSSDLGSGGMADLTGLFEDLSSKGQSSALPVFLNRDRFHPQTPRAASTPHPEPG